MPRSITQYRVFIGSPGGLEAEREQFRRAFEKFNAVNCKHHDLLFEAVGWEDTLPGKGRPQAKINADLEQCDYAIFVFHDRWGSKTNNGDLVGTEEEWEIAQRLYADYQIRAVALYFKDIPEAQRKDPGDELKKVLAFKDKVFAEKKHLCGKFTDSGEFGDCVEEHLAEWLAQHLKPVDANAFATATAAPAVDAPPKASSAPTPDFDFWIREAKAAALGDPANYDATLTYLDRAMPLAGEDAQRVEALSWRGDALYFTGRFPEALASFDQQLELLMRLPVADGGTHVARTLYNKGFILGALDRGAEAITTYDDLITRFGNSDVVAVQEQVANALFKMGFSLGALDRGAEAIAAYDDLIKRFGDSDVAALQEQVANALFNRGCELAKLHRAEDCIIMLDQWADKSGRFDCAMIANDSDFDAIRTDPVFVTYLKSKGCDPAAD